jgi:NADH dehydrogenase/NADH:ubiquinone oxidoreductase subunit G
MTDRTNAERQRRYIARLKAHAAKTGVTNVSDHAALAKELAQARTRIAELEKALASARADTIQHSSEQQQQWTRKSADEKIIMGLKARIHELEALVLPLDSEGKTAVGQHKRKVDREFKARWKRAEAVIMERTFTMTSKDYTLFLAGFHPDASAEMRDKARNRFVALYKKRVLTGEDKVKWP